MNGDIWLAVAALANFGIFAGYFFVALFVAPELDIRNRRTRISGIFFFLTCGLTHLDLGIHAVLREPVSLGDFTSVFHLTNHVVQVIAVWVFVTGIYKEILDERIDWPLPIRRGGR